MGMKLVSFEDPYKHRCLAEYVKRKKNLDNLEPKSQTNFLAGGQFTSSYYSVGTSDRVQEGFFEWCTSDVPANVSSFLKWDTNQPDNFLGVEHCGEIYLEPDNTVPDNIFLNDISCDQKMLKYMCDVGGFHL